MATLVSSTIISDRIQVDGRRKVIESHVFDDGREVRVVYREKGDFSAEKRATERAAAVQLQMDEAEEAAAARQTKEDADAKITDFVNALDDGVLEQIGLTPDEIVSVKP